MNFLKIDPCDLNNGQGARVVLWVSGCSHACKGCHNPESWNCNAGRKFVGEDLEHLFKLLDDPFISGLTLTGGDPLHENNIEIVKLICWMIKIFHAERFKDKDIWIWTGFTMDQIPKDIVELSDYIIDGKFEMDLKESIPWRGSSNQKIYKHGKLVEL